MKKKTNKEYLADIFKIHKDKYDYSEVKYTTSRNKINVICHIHGRFKIIASNFKRGRGCPKCNIPNKYTTATILKKFIEVHKDKYDYSLVEYEHSLKKVKIICPIHGVFQQRPNNHLQKQGCPSCGLSEIPLVKDIIENARKIHNNLYDYSLVKYINNKTKIDIICKEHGVFKQLHTDHLRGHGCPKCSHSFKLNTTKFISRAKKIHNNLYDYSLVNYINNYTKIDIICKEHGVFKQIPKSHLKRRGCPKCKESKGVVEISQLLEKNDLIYEREVIIDGCVSENNVPFRFDFYIPSKNIYIEYDGEQHFRTVKSWGGAEGFKKVQLRDSMKNKFCETHNIKLYRISYKDDINKKLMIILQK